MRKSEVPSKEIAEFLQLKAGPELLLAIGTKGGRWTDIENQIEVSSATLSDRLEKARDLNLIKPSAKGIESSVSSIYRLDKLGEMIYHQMHNTNIASTWAYLKDTQEEFESQKEQLVKWVENDEIVDVYKAHKEKEQTGKRPGSPDWIDDRDS